MRAVHHQSLCSVMNLCFLEGFVISTEARSPKRVKIEGTIGGALHPFRSPRWLPVAVGRRKFAACMPDLQRKAQLHAIAATQPYE